MGRNGCWRGACLRNAAWVKALSEEEECAGALRLEKYRLELLKVGSSDEGLFGTLWKFSSRSRRGGFSDGC